MALEPVTFITDFVDTNPTDSDPRTEGNEHIQRLKTGIQGTFANFAGIAMTATEAELNTLDGVNATLTATELNYNDITTLGTAQTSKVVTASAGDVINFNNFDMTNVDINSGAIDGTPIGSASASTGAFSTVSASGAATLNGNFVLNGTPSGTNVETTLTGGATNLARADAIKTYADGLITAATAAERALNSAGLTTQAHGFGAVPSFISCYLECTVNDGNYTVGDKISFGGTILSPNATSGATVYADATNVYVSVDAVPADEIRVINAAGSAHDDLTSASWKVVATGYNFA